MARKIGAPRNALIWRTDSPFAGRTEVATGRRLSLLGQDRPAEAGQLPQLAAVPPLDAVAAGPSAGAMDVVRAVAGAAKRQSGTAARQQTRAQARDEALLKVRAGARAHDSGRFAGSWPAPEADMPARPAVKPGFEAGQGQRRGRQNPLRPDRGLSEVGPAGLTERLLDNTALAHYERQVHDEFSAIEPVLRRLAAEQFNPGIAEQVQIRLRSELGLELAPGHATAVSSDVWARGLDIPDLYAQCVFARCQQLAADVLDHDPLATRALEPVRSQLLELGYHSMGIAPCADGRLAHVVSYVLRLPAALPRRLAHAGVMFDVSESVRHWVSVEHLRFRSGRPNAAEAPTRHLQVAVYHFSGSDPDHHGCAAHANDGARAATAALQRLRDLREAIENRFCCGAAIDLLLLGLDTDTDALRVHIPDAEGGIRLDRYLETTHLATSCAGLAAEALESALRAAVCRVNALAKASEPSPGMQGLLAWLLARHRLHREYMVDVHGGAYAELGHAERFIGIGDAFDEVQLRNLSYYARLTTVEEGAADLDVGVRKLFTPMYVRRGLPAPVVIRCDYDGRVPGSRARAEARANRLEQAVHERYRDLSAARLLATARSLCDRRDPVPEGRPPTVEWLSGPRGGLARFGLDVLPHDAEMLRGAWR